MRHFFILIPFMLLACSGTENPMEEKVQEKALHVNFSVQIPENIEIKNRKKRQIKTLETFYQLDWEYPDYKYLINYEESDFIYPLNDIFPQGNYSRYKPSLLSLTDISDSLTIAKIGYFHSVEKDFVSLDVIYNILLVEKNGRFQLTNMLRYNTRDWQEKKVDKIVYLAYPGYEFSEKRIQKTLNFNEWMANYFHVNPISFRYYISPSIEKSMQIRGYDFHFRMFFSDQTGAITYLADNIIFVGNDSEYYPHEVVHLYLHEYFPYAHDIIEEGLATYFGGSVGLAYQQHIQTLKAHLANTEMDILNKLYCEPWYTIDEKTSLQYSMGAFLCHLALKECGKQGLIKLLDAGENDEHLSLALEELFGIKIENFNTFITKKLEKYKLPQA